MRELVSEHALDLLRLETAARGRVVTATAACFGLRPVANAFGTSRVDDGDLGLGRSASAHRRSIMSCSSGASSRSTTFAPEAASASLSEVKYWNEGQPDDDQEHRDQADVENLEKNYGEERRRAARAARR